MGKPVSKVADVRFEGPLAPFADGFLDKLRQLGYTPLSAVHQLRLLAHLSRWLDERGWSGRDLTEGCVAEYLASRRSTGYTLHHGRRAMLPLLDFLAAQHVTPIEPQRPPSSGVEALLDGFERYLVSERVLARSTVTAYVARGRRFLVDYTIDGEVSALRTADVTRAITAEAGRVSVGGVQYYVAAVRALLRYCHLQGLVDADLSAAALAATGRRMSLLPRGIGDHDAQALMRACDRRRPIGRRDYAVLLVLLRLGLRAGEVARLGLDDIDWRAGVLVVHGKGGRVDRMPLPADVGAAVTSYLQRGRPATDLREVFVTAIAPIHRLTREAVGGIVRRACVRAGVSPVGPHRLRHTTAVRMVRAGVPLPHIGQALRHQGLTTTAVYTRIDLAALRMLARPWPIGDQR
ncbi:MAG TPA: tyrosine-type recombinase/integrase [Mycobacterium sp.]|nr:tyrosine-type recombinase/integrase [Mycobacterium sp.]HTX96961.1 tyrosine-type recombinase/integrase [Mycobacterium sp.]